MSSIVRSCPSMSEVQSLGVGHEGTMGGRIPGTKLPSGTGHVVRYRGFGVILDLRVVRDVQAARDLVKCRHLGSWRGGTGFSVATRSQRRFGKGRSGELA